MGQAEVRPELALTILERKFPQRWAKVTVVAAPPHHLTFNVADILQKVQERIAQGHVPGNRRCSPFVAKPWPRSPFEESAETRSPRKWLIFRGPCGCGGWI